MSDERLMRVRSVEIGADVAEVLRASTWHEAVLILPPAQLERKLYGRLNKVLEALGGKWNRHKGGHVFSADASAELVAALDTGSVVDRKKTLEQFETPAQLAHRMAMIALTAKPDARRFLEPQAGRGRLVYALHALNPRAPLNLLAIDIDEANCAALREQGIASAVRQADFLESLPEPGEEADAILMNPPFGANADIAHVRHAFENWLAPGGVLVAIMSAHWTFAQDRASLGFATLLGTIESSSERLPAGTFNGEGTGVNATLLVMNKPVDPAPPHAS